jgi:hypothetical protein
VSLPRFQVQVEGSGGTLCQVAAAHSMEVVKDGVSSMLVLSSSQEVVAGLCVCMAAGCLHSGMDKSSLLFPCGPRAPTWTRTLAMFRRV